MTDTATTAPAQPDDETITMPRMEGRRAAVFRHEIRLAAYHIAADCERLLNHAIVGNRRVWRDTLGEALVAARHLLILTEQHLLHGRTGTSDADISAFLRELDDPQRAVVGAMTALLSLVPAGPEDELLLDDARAIRQTAMQLVSNDTVTIPTASAPSGAHTTTPSDAAPASGAKAPPRDVSRNAGVLVVDDEDAGRRVLVKLLERLGYDVRAAENGKRALDLIADAAFDLVITDIGMPEMDGFELLAHLKRDPATREVPVIVVSGADDVDSVVRCIEEGAEDHITKPFELQLLQARVRASLEKKRLRDRELAYLERVAAITEAAKAVQNDTYRVGSLTTRAGGDDALGGLAIVFDRMVSGMQSRENELQDQLRHLKREIRQTRELRRLSSPDVGSISLDSGKVLGGRYEIITEIGEGGMGSVYRALDRELSEELAIKMVRSDLVGSDPTLIERLKQEMRLTRKISHRNVVRAYDLGEWQGTYFLTMEYVEGVTVQDLLDMHGRLSIASTLAIGIQLAEALAVAHAESVIHRDIKPRNLIVDQEGVLKVMDFGLARLVERGADMTRAGFVVGTPRYMSPEQLIGADVDGRSDLYSVGVVLYQCLTGHLPFEAETPTALAAKVFEERPRPVTDVVSHVPQGLATIVHGLLAASPDGRPGSARELAAQLRVVG